MSEADQMIGAFKEFKEWEREEHSHIRKDLTEIKEKVEALRLWRASILGMSGLVGAVAGFLTRFL